MKAAKQPTKSELARMLLSLGGRFSSELGIELEAGGAAIERWALAATLFGARISAATAMRTYRALSAAGVTTLAEAAERPDQELVELLDRGGYARYDFRTAEKLKRIGAMLVERGDGTIWSLIAGAQSYAQLAARLKELPGWGDVTVALFLRELRGVLDAAQPPLDPRAREAALHLGILASASPRGELSALRALAHRAGVDPRDLEAALIRLALAHGRTRAIASCPGGRQCVALARAPERQGDQRVER